MVGKLQSGRVLLSQLAADGMRNGFIIHHFEGLPYREASNAR
jgi:hypothetical protein